MNKLLSLLLFFLFSKNIAAQELKKLGKWQGEWYSLDAYYSYKLALNVYKSGEVDGYFIWKLEKILSSDIADHLSKYIGYTATEIVTGTYDQTTNELLIKGIIKDDPYAIIDMDTYQIKLKKGGKILTGTTKMEGDWKGIIIGNKCRKFSSD